LACRLLPLARAKLVFFAFGPTRETHDYSKIALSGQTLACELLQSGRD
jgi:hypothetical protein